MSNVIVVCGAPGSGKTTYVKERLKEKDIVWDMDYVRRALCLQDNQSHDMPIATLNMATFLRTGFMAYIKKYWLRYDNIYVITSAKPYKAQKIADDYEGKLVVMPAKMNECIEHIMNDVTRKNIGKQIELVKDWYKA